MWNLLIVDPMTNALLFIYGLIGQNFGLAIILFTIFVRLLTYPLTARQMKSTQAMQELQKSDKYKKIQENHKNDREKLAQEQMKLYKEFGVNPLGSCLPTVIQFPIIIGLYQAVISALAATPLQLVEFVEHLYPIFPDLAALVPLKSQFLWMDLSQPERLFVPFLSFGIPTLAILVAITSFLQTKLMTPTTGGDDQSAMMGRMMGLYFPLFLGYLAYTFPAGLAVYFVASNLVGILQYAATGRLEWRNLLPGGKVEDSPSTGSSKKIVKKAKSAGGSKPASNRKAKKARSS
jgi:YidC/Oxa1 family membrane protein insertase